MTTRNHQWHGTSTDFPQLYDLIHSDEKADIDMYERLSEGMGNILECGIGTGRVAIPLARAGRKIVGIDSSRKMLRTLALKLKDETVRVRKRIHFRQVDMQDFDLNEKFDMAIIPFMTFNYLSTLDQQKQCLHHVSRHLRQGGRFVVELMAFHPQWFYDDEIARFIFRKQLQNGRSVELFRTTRFDSSSQIVEHDRTFRFIDRRGIVEREQVVLWRNRFFFLGEATLLLREANFAIDAVWGDHSGSPYTKASRVMIIHAHKNA